MEKIRTESLVSELLAIFYIQKKQIQLTFLLVFLGFIAYVAMAPDVYRANGSFLVKAKKAERSINTLEKTDVKAPSITEEDLYTESAILSSDEVLTKAATKIIKQKLANVENPTKKSEKVIIDDFSKQLGAALTVDVLPKSKVIQPALLWKNPKEAAIILNTLMWVYLEQRQSIESPTQTTDFLNNQVGVYLTDWKNKKSEIIMLTEKYNAPNPDLELTNNLLLKKDYITQINQLEEKRDTLKSDVSTLEKMLSDGQNHIYSFMGNNVLASLVDSLQGAQKEKEEAEKIFLPKRSEVREANELFQNSYKTIRGETLLHLQQQKSTLRTVNDTLLSFNSKLKNLELRNIQLKKLSVQMEQIQMESSLMASSFEVFYNRRDESQLKGTLESNVAILSHAKSELGPVKPMRGKIMLLGVFLAIALSLTIALLLNTADQTIKTPRDVENYLYSPVIFSIEDIHDANINNSNKKLFYFIVIILVILASIYFINSFINNKSSSPLISSTVKQKSY